MARLALLALLLSAAALPRPPSHTLDSSADTDSASFDPFVLLDDYDDSFEPSTTTTARPKTSAKVILRAKGPKVNATVKNTKSEHKKINVKSTTVKYTKLSVTENPSWSSSWRPWLINDGQRPLVEVSPQFVLVDTSVKLKRSTRRPPAQTQPPPVQTESGPAHTRKPNGPRTTRRPSTTTQKSERTTRRPNKSTKKTQINSKTTPCPPKGSGWLSSYFQGNKKKNVQKTPSKSTWFSVSGFISKIYGWLWGSKKTHTSSWFDGGSWFQEEKQTTSTTTTTTPTPLTTTTSNWFQSLLETEEDDGAYVNNNTKKTPRKAMKTTYKGFQLIRAYPDAQWKVHELLDLQEESQEAGVKWWTTPSINGSTDLLVPPDLLVDIKDHLKSLKIDFDVVIWDLQKAIMYENPKLSKKQRIEMEQLRGHPMTWRRYHRYADMLRYLEYLQHSYTDLVELIPLGRSSEGLPLVAVKVALPKNETYTKEVQLKGSKNKYKLRSRMKPVVWVEAGAHAREWIAPAVATWMLHALVEGEIGQGSEYEVLKQADFYIMPMLNPDGYEHSHTHDRLWRKTRSRHAEQSEDDFTSWFPWNWGRGDCVGVDADRNWDYHWGEQGASRDPCADTYAGPHPFSEPETRAVSTFLSEHRDRVKVYLSLHAYSQAWLTPSSHAHTSFADDGVLMEMGKLATVALADLYGTKYQVGTAAELRQPASGMSHDWAKARAGVKFSYHVDLRDSYGPYGFLLPGSQIVPTARETWLALRTIVDNLN